MSYNQNQTKQQELDCRDNINMKLVNQEPKEIRIKPNRKEEEDKIVREEGGRKLSKSG